MEVLTIHHWQQDSEGWYHRPCDMYSIDGACPGCGSKPSPAPERALTSMDIKALKMANNICFDHDRLSERKNGFDGSIRALKRRSLKEREDNPYIDESVTYSIPVSMSTVKVYGHTLSSEEKNHIRDGVHGYVFTPSNGIEDILSTVWTIAKPGDVPRLLWCYDAGNQIVEKVNLHTDHLYLELERRGKNGKSRKFKFFIDASTCSDNSARMLRRY